MTLRDEITVTVSGGSLDSQVGAALEHMIAERFAERLWAREGSLFGGSPERAVVVENRLGWLDGPQWLREHVDELTNFAREIGRSGFTSVVLLGMGGSSLCPEVLSHVFGLPAGLRTFAIVDATDPATILRVEAEIDLAHTLFIVASKSGGTTETRSQAAYFFERLQSLGLAAGPNFIAITDSSSSLERWAEEAGFRRVFLNPGDIGGRYSALFCFGMVPGSLLGLPLGDLARRSALLAGRLAASTPENPGLRLGACIGAAARAGRDKLTFVTGPGTAPIIPWIEQLVAESTGKEGTGIVPIEAEPEGRFEAYGTDRLFCFVDFEGEKPASKLALQVKASGSPHVEVRLSGKADLGALFLLWEFAVSASGFLLGINPFDEPNVQESKDNTNLLLAGYDASGAFSEPPPQTRTDAFDITVAGSPARTAEDLIARFHAALSPGDYLAFLYFADRNAGAEALLSSLRALVRDHRHLATLRGYGPRFLHSIGQLYKGGRPNGHFVLFTADTPRDLPIAGSRHGFAALLRAQALGDFEALAGRGRPVLRVHLKGEAPRALAAFTETWKQAVAAVG